MRVFMRLLLSLTVFAVFGMADTVQTQGAPLVVFVEEGDLQMASVTDNGPDGLTRLAAIFQQQGARTSFIRLDDPIPDEVQVVVLIRPRRPLSPLYLTRLWVYLENGGSLLLALDPVGQLGNPDAQNGGVDRLFGSEYGIRLLNGLIVEPWFTNETARNIRLSNFYSYPNRIDHPVIQPLLDYEVPVMMWGARNLRSEFFAPYSTAFGLLYADAFAETNTLIYRAEDPAPLQVNIGTDDQGRLTVGAIAENTANQSRIAVFGDSEIFQNDFGLAPIPGSQTPLHAGNYILAQRVASWLLNLPVEDWESLPNVFTWLSIDGDGADWENRGSLTTDASDDNSILSQNIQQVRGFRNQDYLYLQIEMLASPDPFARLLIDVDSDVNGQVDRTLSVDIGQSVFTEGDQQTGIPDARMGVDRVIEVRLPLRVTGAGGIVTRICLSTTREMAFAVEPDCVENISVPLIDQQDPSELQIPNTALATVRTTDVINLRSGPGTDFDIITRFRNGEVVAVIGRSENGEWIQIQTSRYEGWASISLLQLNTSVELLPIMP